MSYTHKNFLIVLSQTSEEPGSGDFTEESEDEDEEPLFEEDEEDEELEENE